MNYPPPTNPSPAHRSGDPLPAPPTIRPYPPAQPPAPAQTRNRRSDRGRVSSSPSGRRKKRPGPWELTLWQGAVIFLLVCAVFYAGVQLGKAGASMRALTAQRQAEQERYEQSVRNHQVKYRDLIEKYAAEYGLNPAYVSAIIMQESGYDPRAVSNKGAMGLMQFMPNTFDWVAPNCGISKSNVNAVYEPENAIKMGCYLLRYICRQLKSDDPVLVACAYHAGWGTVPSWLENYSSDGVTLEVSQIPKSDTRTYAGRVLNSYAIYLQHYY